jgi:hypothetical protein
MDASGGIYYGDSGTSTKNGVVAWVSNWKNSDTAYGVNPNDYGGNSSDTYRTSDQIKSGQATMAQFQYMNDTDNFVLQRKTAATASQLEDIIVVDKDGGIKFKTDVTFEKSLDQAAVVLNTAKTGITDDQALAITANTAKTSDINHLTSYWTSRINTNSGKTSDINHLTSYWTNRINTNANKVGMTSNLISLGNHGGGWWMNNNSWIRAVGTAVFIAHSTGLTWSGRYFNGSAVAFTACSSCNSTVGLEVASGIVASWVGANSDRRIKKNIEDIDDGDALKLLRKIPVRYYNYKDVARKGTEKVAGFIAQEVKEVFPMAVSTSPYDKPIPNILKKITNEVWEEITDSSENKWLLKKFDLIDSDGVILPADISGGKSYHFNMQDELDDKGDEESILSDSSGNFIFAKKWKYLFLFGICVNDFHVVDKNKIFAINFSASQEIDRIQQQHIIDIAAIKLELQNEKNKTKYFEDKLRDIEERLSVGGL